MYFKVGAPPALASVLEEISRENHLINIIAPLQIGNDPELDHFMVFSIWAFLSFFNFDHFSLITLLTYINLARDC